MRDILTFGDWIDYITFVGVGDFINFVRVGEVFNLLGTYSLITDKVFLFKSNDSFYIIYYLCLFIISI